MHEPHCTYMLQLARISAVSCLSLAVAYDQPALVCRSSRRRQQRLTHDLSASGFVCLDLPSVHPLPASDRICLLKRRLPSASNSLFRPNPGTPRSARHFCLLPSSSTGSKPRRRPVSAISADVGTPSATTSELKTTLLICSLPDPSADDACTRPSSPDLATAPSSPSSIGLPRSSARNPSCSACSVAAEPIACPDLPLVRPHLSAFDPSTTGTGCSVGFFRSVARRRSSTARRPLLVDRPSLAVGRCPPVAAALAAGGVFPFLGKKVEHPITMLQQHTKISVHPQCTLFGAPSAAYLSWYFLIYHVISR
ncbi:hypothetical protein ACLOJK_017572 [Asimina triloba]